MSQKDDEFYQSLAKDVEVHLGSYPEGLTLTELAWLSHTDKVSVRMAVKMLSEAGRAKERRRRFIKTDGAVGYKTPAERQRDILSYLLNRPEGVSINRYHELTGIPKTILGEDFSSLVDLGDLRNIRTYRDRKVESIYYHRANAPVPVGKKREVPEADVAAVKDKEEIDRIAAHMRNYLLATPEGMFLEEYAEKFKVGYEMCLDALFVMGSGGETFHQGRRVIHANYRQKK